MSDKQPQQFKAIPKETPKADAPKAAPPKPDRPPEFGGPSGPEPTRYGDWERNGKVSDF
jgi:hypothetical protein